MAHQIDCIEKEDRDDPAEAIKFVGGLNADGTRWKITQKDAISRIKSGQNTFYVLKDGKRTNVVVSISRWGNEYLKTEADTTTSNNLLSLQECRWAA